MPLQERSPEFEKALQALQGNIESIDLPTKQSHTFYSILAGTGAGKSRLGQEIAVYIKKTMPNTYTARIDFSNGDRIRPSQEAKSSATVILGLRVAARLLFDCSSAELLDFLSACYKELPLQVFSFPTVMEAFFQQRLNNDQPEMANLVLILDEINRLLDDVPPIAKEILQVIGSYMCNSSHDLTETSTTYINPASNHKLGLLPIISGTIIGHLESDIRATSFAYKIGAVPMLSIEATTSIFSAVFPDRILWLNNQTFKRTLKVLGRLPRCLEKIIEVCQVYGEHKQLTSDLAQLLAEKAYDKIKSLYSVSNVHHITLISS